MLAYCLLYLNKLQVKFYSIIKGSWPNFIYNDSLHNKLKQLTNNITRQHNLSMFVNGPCFSVLVNTYLFTYSA